jgi:leucyl aminopeptidase
LGLYRITKFRSNVDKNNYKTYFYHPKTKYKNIINEAIYEATIQNEIRTLTNTPANILNSIYFKKYISNNLNKSKYLKMTTLNETQLKKLGLNLILSVNQGSNNQPLLINIEYKKLNSKKSSNNNSKPIVFIGKGVMFDSGGYSIKGGDFSDMKNDMNGSAVVYGLMQLISNAGINGHFIGLLPFRKSLLKRGWPGN